MSTIRLGSVTATTAAKVENSTFKTRGLLHWVNRQTGVAICGRRVSGRPIERPDDRIRAIGERGICPSCNVGYLEMSF